MLLFFYYYFRSFSQNPKQSLQQYKISYSSHFGTPLRNVITPLSGTVKTEVEDVGVSEVTPENNLLKGSQVQDSSGATQDLSNDDSQDDGGINQGVADEKEPCVYCGQNPCDWAAFEDEINKECEVLEELKRSNKEICHHAYHLYTQLKHGVLHKFDQR